MRRLLILISIIGALAVPATAAAVEPTRDTLHVTTITPAPCPSGVVLIGVFSVTREITTFYDNDGNALRQLWVASFEGTWTNPQTGASLPNWGVRVFHRDLVTGGAGRLVFDSAGRLVEHNGPDMAEESAQRCAALGA